MHTANYTSLLAPDTVVLLLQLGLSGDSLKPGYLAACCFVSDGLYTAVSDAAVILHHRLLLAQRDRTTKTLNMIKSMVSVLLPVIASKSGGETALPYEILI